MTYNNQTYTKAKDLSGHTCEGFQEFQSNGEQEYGTCTPFINNKGLIEGCDNTNDIPLKFCPFCGEKLDAIQEKQD